MNLFDFVSYPEIRRRRRNQLLSLPNSVEESSPELSESESESESESVFVSESVSESDLKRIEKE